MIPKYSLKMENADTIECPYCTAEIKSYAEVCMHCRRDVGKLIELQNKNRELETRSGKIETAPGPIAAVTTKSVKNRNRGKNKSKIHPGIFAVSYFIISTIALTFALTIYATFFTIPLYEIVFFVMIPVVIYLGIKLIDEFNIWTLAVPALFQPKIIIYLSNYFGIVHSIEELNSFYMAPYLFFFYTCLTALAFSIILDKVKPENIFNLDYLTNSDSKMEKVKKMVLYIVGLYLALKSLTDII